MTSVYELGAATLFVCCSRFLSMDIARLEEKRGKCFEWVLEEVFLLSNLLTRIEHHEYPHDLLNE